MAALDTDRDAATRLIKDLSLADYATVACVNSPESVTISGDVAAIEDIIEHLSAKGIFARKLKTGGRAYHSHHMARIGQNY
jgi:acyl transferase domain-containing protein